MISKIAERINGLEARRPPRTEDDCQELIFVRINLLVDSDEHMNELKEYLSVDDLKSAIRQFCSFGGKNTNEQKVFKQETSLLDLLLSRRRNKIISNCYRKKYGNKY
ncbi:hypothetical protein JTB14_031268 [Gonioctena quinquepunctata]|nr:hypothetical protein JTB14_031268 [Gonioctena quinquepunctata]